MKALRRAGWSVHVLDEREFIPLHWRTPVMRALARAVRRLAVREFNRELVRQANALQPELLLVFKGTFVDARSLNALKALGVRTYCFYPDVSFRVHGPYVPRALPAYDWIFTTKSFGPKDLREQLGATRASVILHAFDSDVHRIVDLTPADLAPYACDLSFIGTWSPKKEQVLTEIRGRRPALALRIWGAQWAPVARRNKVLRDVIVGSTVQGEDYVRAIRASAINLAILSEARTGASSGDHITSRTFHIPAAGGFMLHERTDELLRVFDEPDEVVAYANVDELVARIDQALGDEPMRRRVTARAHDVVHAAHSWDHRIRELLAVHEASTS
ncbi:MAG TPA: glycosyltransferase [Vicinamibacterales bacterium]|nr:glycosyltransferase [Vicinamibacterales bacterium]